MGLIDADKLMESLNPKESVWVGLVLSELIANAPTVKAIPVEWLKRRGMMLAAYRYDTCADLIRALINDWEQENARD